MKSENRAKIDAERILDPMDKTKTLSAGAARNMAREYLRLLAWARELAREEERSIPGDDVTRP